jgi:hypothetical protein
MKCGATFSLHTPDVSLVLKVAIIMTGPLFILFIFICRSDFNGVVTADGHMCQQRELLTRLCVVIPPIMTMKLMWTKVQALTLPVKSYLKQGFSSQTALYSLAHPYYSRYLHSRDKHLKSNHM